MCDKREMPMTLQTDTPIENIQIQTSARCIEWFRQLADDTTGTELDIDQPYQRGHVWSEDRRRLLIRSLMQGIPVGAITVNDRFAAGFHEPEYGPARSANRNWSVAIIDGKQRFTTFVQWLRSELSVPASWFPGSEIVTTEDTADGRYVRLDGLAVRQARFFRSMPVPVVTAKVRTLAEERAIFELVNFGGVAMGESDGAVDGMIPAGSTE